MHHHSFRPQTSLQGSSACRRLQPHAARQQGIALFVVIVFVLLSMLLALWASRTSLFNEMVVGNDANYQRAFEAAQALIQDAELDIRGEMADGTICNAAPCRAYTGKLQFPGDTSEINPLITLLQAEPTRCKDGMCARRVGRQDFWNYEKTSTPIKPEANYKDAVIPLEGEAPLSDLVKEGVGARYGQYTGAKLGSSEKPANPILADTAEGRGGWYWIEILRYSDKAKSANVIVDSANSQLPLNLDVYVIYRITALAIGPKPGTSVVLQETYARQRVKD